MTSAALPATETRVRPRAHLFTIALLAVVLLFAASIRLKLLGIPFQRHAEGCAAFFGLVARNYFRYDFSTTWSVPVMSMGQGAPPVFYANHPPTTPMLIAIVYALGGYHGGFDWIPADWQVRLPTALFTLGCIVLIFQLVRSRANDRAAILAAALFTSIPMTLVYGGFPDVISSQLVLFAVLTVAGYERFHDAPTWKSFALLLAAFTGAGICDWPAFFLLPVLAIHFICTRRPKQWAWIVGFGVATSALFVLLYAHATLGQTDWKWMAMQFRRRSLSSATDSAHAFTLAEWFRVAIWQLAIGRHTLIVLVLAIAWLAMAAFRKFSGGADRMTALLLSWAVVHVLIGKQGVFMHEWWWWPLTPGVVMAAALAADQLLSFLHKKWSISNAVLNSAAAICLAVFAAINARSAMRELLEVPPMIHGPLDYTLAELGETIRASVAPDAAVMVADSDKSLPFWYYADRGVKRGVWDWDTFNTTLQHPTVDLTFDLPVPWPGRFGAMIIPKAFLDKTLPPLVKNLDEKYPRTETAKFVVWNLRAAN